MAEKRPTALQIPYVACPLCESSKISFFKEQICEGHPSYDKRLPTSLRWVRCEDCKHVFTEGYWTAPALDIVFSRTQPNQQVGVNFEAERLVSARMVQRVASFIDGGAWLDVGFGNGSLLFTADEFGYEAVGCDLRAEGVDRLERIGLEAYRADIADLGGPDGRFSVISMADVLEHMPFPKIGLAAARRLLRPGGVLFTSMPNMDAFAWHALDRIKSNPYWGEIEHYHNFGRLRLYALLKECGFNPVQYAVSERYRVCMEIISIRQ